MFQASVTLAEMFILSLFPLGVYVAVREVELFLFLPSTHLSLKKVFWLTIAVVKRTGRMRRALLWSQYVESNGEVLYIPVLE